MAPAVAVIELSGEPLTEVEAQRLVDTALALSHERDHRCVLVRSAGDSFCPGGATGLDASAMRLNPAEALAGLGVPVVAAIHGRCDGVGLELALTCDVLLATADTRFRLSAADTQPFPCWGGTQRLPRAIGHARATSMLMVGEEVDAATALAWGLVHAVFDDTAALRQAEAELCDQLADRAPFALELAKEAVRRGSELPLREGLRLEGDLNHLLASTDDRAEGLAAFFEKRQPHFRGR